MKMQSKPSQAPQLVLQKICEQIEQEISTLLSNISVQDAATAASYAGGQDLLRTLQKQATSTKTTILRTLSCRLPQIITVQQRCRKVVVQIGDELQAQRNRFKQLLQKYERCVLECDRYKMETVSTNQAYLELEAQNVRLRGQIGAGCGGCGGLRERLGELECGEQIANQRIYNLLEQSQKTQQTLQQQHLTITLLKQQLSTQILHTEHLTQAHIQTQSQLTNKLSQTIKQHQSLKTQYTTLQHKIKDIQEELQRKLQEADRLKGTVGQLEQQVAEFRGRVGELEEEVGELRGRVKGVDDVRESHGVLRDKYRRKMELVTQQLEEIKDKNKFYKSENQRLYQAMQLYANRQLKLVSQLKKLQTSTQHQKKCSQKQLQTLKSAQLALSTTKSQLHTLKSSFQTTIQNLIISSTQSCHSLLQSLMQSLMQKVEGQVGQSKGEIDRFRRELQAKNEEVRMLGRLRVEAEGQGTKIASTLIAQKNQAYLQLSRKQQRIRNLEEELAREKAIVGQTLHKLTNTVSRYQGTVLADIGNAASTSSAGVSGYAGSMHGYGGGFGEWSWEGVGSSGQLQRIAGKQRARFVGLQSQFRNFVEK